jgi:hypothetical protein
MSELVISDNESVSDSSSEEEQIAAPLVPEPKKKGGKSGRKNARKSAERVAEDMLKEKVADTIPMRGRGKKTITKKVAEEKGEVEELPTHIGGDMPPPPESPAPVKKPKRTVSPKTKARLVAQLEKGRATRAANFKKKKEERESLLEKVKMKIAEPSSVKEVHHYHNPAPPEDKPAPKPKAVKAVKAKPQPVFV